MDGCDPLRWPKLFLENGKRNAITRMRQGLSAHIAGIRLMNIFDELYEGFEDTREEYTDPHHESEVIVTSDVNGFLTNLKDNRELNDKILVLMPIKEYVCFK